MDERILSLVKRAGSVAGLMLKAAARGGVVMPAGCACHVGAQDRIQGFLDDTQGGAVEIAKRWLETNPDNAYGQVIAYDGYITLDGWRTDAIFMLFRWTEPQASMRLILRYQAPEKLSLVNFFRRRKPFVIYRPKATDAEPEFDEVADMEPGFDLQDPAVWDAFYEGMHEVPAAGELWNKHLDASR